MHASDLTSHQFQCHICEMPVSGSPFKVACKPLFACCLTPMDLACTGAFVAGNDAGHAYNTFPTMNGHWVPDEYQTHPGWRNAFESTAAVQFHHRCLALSTLAATGAIWALHHSSSALPVASRRMLHALAGMAGLQVRVICVNKILHLPSHKIDALHIQGQLFAPDRGKHR